MSIKTNVPLLESHIVEAIMEDYKNLSYAGCIEQLDVYFVEHPEMKQKHFIKNIYINSCLNIGKLSKDEAEFECSKRYFNKLLNFETDLQFKDSIILYHVYRELSEVCESLGDLEISKEHKVMSEYIINRMVAGEIIQGMYVAFVEGDYDYVIEKMDTLNVETLDNYNQGRYYMMIGSAYYYKEAFLEATTYLEKAMPYYESSTYNSVITMIYEDLSKCYTGLDDYDQALIYLKKAKESQVG